MSEMTSFLEKNKEQTVIGVCIFLSFFVAKFFYDTQVQKYTQIKQQIQTEQEKGQSLTRMIAVVENIKKLRQHSWPSVDFNLVVTQITEECNAAGIKLLDISPSDKREDPNYVLFTFSLAGEGLYPNILKFFEKLDLSSRLVGIRDVTITSPQLSRGRNEPVLEDKFLLDFRAMAEAVYFK